MYLKNDRKGNQQSSSSQHDFISMTTIFDFSHLLSYCFLTPTNFFKGKKNRTANYKMKVNLCSKAQKKVPNAMGLKKER